MKFREELTFARDIQIKSHLQASADVKELKLSLLSLLKPKIILFDIHWFSTIFVLAQGTRKFQNYELNFKVWTSVFKNPEQVEDSESDEIKLF